MKNAGGVMEWRRNGVMECWSDGVLEWDPATLLRTSPFLPRTVSKNRDIAIGARASARFNARWIGGHGSGLKAALLSSANGPKARGVMESRGSGALEWGSPAPTQGADDGTPRLQTPNSKKTSNAKLQNLPRPGHIRMRREGIPFSEARDSFAIGGLGVFWCLDLGTWSFSPTTPSLHHSTLFDP